MKSQTVAISLLGAVGTVSAGPYAAMDIETWCLTYVSTYLVPVSVPTGSLSSSARGSEGTTKGGSLEPTFGGDTSTQTITDTGVKDASTSLTSLIIAESLQTSLSSSISSGPSSLDIDLTQTQSGSSDVTLLTTILTVTVEPTTSMDSTASTDLTPTSTGIGINEPAGRTVIFQIVIPDPDNEKRSLEKRATSGFVGNDNPDICTFATAFNLAEGQLFDGSVPIFYSGEDFKELSGQDSPSSDAITRTFEASGRQLVFRNSDLPNGEASFCQNSNGLIYIVFTAGPSSCIPVNLAIYDVEQCQNGVLVGDELTSTTEITNSETTSPETTSPTIITASTNSVVISQSSQAVVESTRVTEVTEVTASIEPSSKGLDESSTAQTDSVESASDTASSKITTVSSRAIDLSDSLSSIITTQPVQETSPTEVSALPNTEDNTSMEGVSVSPTITTGLAAQTSTTLSDTIDNTTTEGDPVSETSTTEISTSSDTPDGTGSNESSSIESTESASFTTTTIDPEDSTTVSSSPTSETTSEVLADTTTSTAESTEAGTTTTLTGPDETTGTVVDVEDTTTPNPDVGTTSQGDTTATDTTTAAVEAPTTEPNGAGTTVHAPAPPQTTIAAPT